MWLLKTGEIRRRFVFFADLNSCLKRWFFNKSQMFGFQAWICQNTETQMSSSIIRVLLCWGYFYKCGHIVLLFFFVQSVTQLCNHLPICIVIIFSCCQWLTDNAFWIVYWCLWILSTQDCINLCKSVIQNELPDLSALALKVNDDDILLSILLASLDSDDKMPESDLKDHSNQRRSYSMEHFRWGKPSGRKRRPVKVFASSLEGGGRSEGKFALQVRRQRSSNEDKAKEDFSGDSNQNQGLPRSRGSSKSQSQVSPQQRKDGSYRMSHFRWGSPTVSKRNGKLMKTWDGIPLRQLAKIFRNILVKDVERIMGWMESGAEGEGWAVESNSHCMLVPTCLNFKIMSLSLACCWMFFLDQRFILLKF